MNRNDEEVYEVETATARVEVKLSSWSEVVSWSGESIGI